MEKPKALTEKKFGQFDSPQEELNFLREQVKQKEATLASLPDNQPEKEITALKEVLSEYSSQPDRSNPSPSHEAIVLDLAPRPSDEQVNELLGILTEEGLKNTLTVLKKMDDPALTDDFHRVLVQYIKTGHLPEKNFQKSPLASILQMTLYEVSLPNQTNQSEKTIKELIAEMEYFYTGMLTLNENKDKWGRYFSLEIAVANEEAEIVFYMAIPRGKERLFEKQLLSVFPQARLREKKDDYNIFAQENYLAGSRLVLKKKAIYPLKNYTKFDYDPLNLVLNSLSRIKEGEGAAVQLIFNAEKNNFNQTYRTALNKLQNGVSPTKALDLPESHLGNFAKALRETFFTQTPQTTTSPTTLDEELIENIKDKISSPIVKVNLRLLVSSQTQAEAEKLLAELEAPFQQLEKTSGNKIIFQHLTKSALKKLTHNFSFREFNKKHSVPLNLKEITTLLHLPNTNVKTTSPIRQTKAKTAAAPLHLPQTGTLLGINNHHNHSQPIYFAPEDRLRHFYTIGQTGVGKTVLLKNMIIQDIQNGDGVCYIDPHGSDIQDVLANIPPERYEDVIYFDPTDTEVSPGLNMLEYDPRFPDQKTFVVNEMLSIFDKLFDMKTTGGPIFEQYFRNAVQLVIDNPNDHSTLLDVSRVLADEQFRQSKLAKCSNPIVTQFWQNIASQSDGEASLKNIVPYITSKFDVFLSNDTLRPIIAQAQSAFNFREVMDQKKILLVNLSKGQLGEINSHLLGLILVGKIMLAALSRADSSTDKPPFYLYIDEFQNVTTDSISVILSEARKYKLSLNLAHQFIAQLDEKIKQAVFGNVGSLAIFRVGQDDADYLEKQFAPEFTAQDITNLDNWNAYLKILANGQPQKPFNIQTKAPQKGRPDIIEQLKELSRLKYGKKRQEIDQEILNRYNS